MQKSDRIGQSQFYDLITGEEVSWQSVIYDLIKTEQLDPWDIDLGVLAEKYSQVIEEMQEANFFVSSKVLYACALLLRLKSEFLTNRFIRELDDALYGRKDEKYEIERIEIDEDELPVLVPRTPMARFKKVSLKELMGALNQAMETENRRIRREIKQKQAEKSALVVLPNKKKVPLKSRIVIVFSKIRAHVFGDKHARTKVVNIPKINEHMPFSVLAKTKQEKLDCFLPILQLSNNGKLWLRQENHFDEIFMHLDEIEEQIEGLEIGDVEVEN
jgi:chromatin segregation and condensation protein Rec8/ScpA/Scc1 (kleisin family)